MRRSSLIFTTRLRRQAKAFLANTADYIKEEPCPNNKLHVPNVNNPS